MMRYEVIVEPDLIFYYQKIFEEAIIREMKVLHNTLIPARNMREAQRDVVYYDEELPLWYCSSVRERNHRLACYFNGFGIDDREDKFLDIEINFPHRESGYNRDFSGRFIKKSDGNVLVAHKGRIYGTDMNEFLDAYPIKEDVIVAHELGRTQRYAVVSELKDKEIVKNIYEFIKNVRVAKETLETEVKTREEPVVFKQVELF